MNRSSLPHLCAALDGGFFAGLVTRYDRPINVQPTEPPADGGSTPEPVLKTYAVIVAPRDKGESTAVMLPHGTTGWLETDEDHAEHNTSLLLALGSEAATWVRGLTIDGHADWQLPTARDLELIYRVAKPTTTANQANPPQDADKGSVFETYAYLQIRHPSSTPPSDTYTDATPAQTADTAFQEGGEQAFKADFYGSSSSHGGVGFVAQHFDTGRQAGFPAPGATVLVRAVRYVEIED